MLLHPLSVFLGTRLPTKGFIRQPCALSQPRWSPCLHAPNMYPRELAGPASETVPGRLSAPLLPPPPATPRHLLVHEYQPMDAMLQESFCFFISLNQFKSALGPPPSRLEGNVISVIIGTPHFQGLCRGTYVLPKQQVGPSGHGLWCLLATAEMHVV